MHKPPYSLFAGLMAGWLGKHRERPQPSEHPPTPRLPQLAPPKRPRRRYRRKKRSLNRHLKRRRRRQLAKAARRRNRGRS